MLNKERIIIFLLKNKFTIIVSVLTAIAICTFFYFINSSKPAEENSLPYEVVTNNVTNIDRNNNKVEEKNDELAIVDIKGAVKNPGVYELEKSKRIKDAIELAGGLLEESDTSKVNLSQKVKDQMLIVIPKIGEKIVDNTTTNGSDSSSKVININTATKEELMKISGVGESKAKLIIDYRENKGEFKTKEDITKVKGIGKGTFEKIKEEIDV